jgi:hypothetical protein
MMKSMEITSDFTHCQETFMRSSKGEKSTEEDFQVVLGTFFYLS